MIVEPLQHIGVDIRLGDGGLALLAFAPQGMDPGSLKQLGHAHFTCRNATLSVTNSGPHSIPLAKFNGIYPE